MIRINKFAQPTRTVLWKTSLLTEDEVTEKQDRASEPLGTRVAAEKAGRQTCPSHSHTWMTCLISAKLPTLFPLLLTRQSKTTHLGFFFPPILKPYTHNRMQIIVF